MIDKVFTYYEFLFEGNTPEDYIQQCFTDIKNRLKPVFNVEGEEESKEKVKKMGDFNNANLTLVSMEDNLYSKSEKNLAIKFLDGEETQYVLNIRISIEDAVNDKQGEDFHVNDIKKAHITFKKYGDVDDSYDIVNQLMDRTVDPSTIDGDFLIKLKMDLDKGKEPDEEEFKIETDTKPEEETQNKDQNTQGQGQTTPAQSGQNKPQGQGQAQQPQAPPKQ